VSSPPPPSTGDAPRVSVSTAEHVAGAVYGTIIATAVVAASAGPQPDSLHIIGLLVGTSTVFWLAHVYSRSVAVAIELGRRVTRAEQARLAAQEWPMLQSSVPLVVALIPGELGWIEVSASLWLAVGVGVAALVVWGIRIGQLEGRGGLNVLRNAVVTGSFGLLIVALKAWVSH
jgi:hypothetical protein